MQEVFRVQASRTKVQGGGLKNINWWTRLRVGIGIFILPMEAKKIVVRALNPQVLVFSSPEEFAKWLSKESPTAEIIELTEAQVIEKGKVH